MKRLPMKALMDAARAGRYAVPAFNVCNLENVQCVLNVAERMRSPVIIQAHFLEVDYAGARTLVELVRSVGDSRNLAVSVHLDHGESMEHVLRCIQGGFNSVMYDGSALPLEENIANLKKVVEIASTVGVTVEGEIGTIGQTNEMGEKLEKSYLTDPQSAARLAEESGVDCLAVAIGNAHGVYLEEPRLDFGRLAEIANLVRVPLVLHGGTGIPAEQVRQAIKMGVAKVNFSTALRKAFITAVREHLAAKPDDLALMDILSAGSARMETAVGHAVELCMSAGKLA